MPFKVRVSDAVRKRIRGWPLSDFALAEVDYQILQVLPQRPAESFRREHGPLFDGMVFRFSCLEHPQSARICRFAFQVFYAADEVTLLVAQGDYDREAPAAPGTPPEG